MAVSTARSRVLDEIRTLDPVADHQRIVFLSTCFDFPFDTTRALELALFRTFCIPSVSRLLDRTGEFQNRAQKRYDDTDLIVSELVEWGYSSERGARALARMNAIHGRFKIANTDFLYVLSTFVFEPIPQAAAVETLEFEALEGGRTRLKATILHTSKASRDGQFNAGMERGLREAWDKLEELLAGTR